MYRISWPQAEPSYFDSLDAIGKRYDLSDTDFDPTLDVPEITVLDREGMVVCWITTEPALRSS